MKLKNIFERVNRAETVNVRGVIFYVGQYQHPSYWTVGTTYFLSKTPNNQNFGSGNTYRPEDVVTDAEVSELVTTGVPIYICRTTSAGTKKYYQVVNSEYSKLVVGSSGPMCWNLVTIESYNKTGFYSDNGPKAGDVSIAQYVSGSCEYWSEGQESGYDFAHDVPLGYAYVTKEGLDYLIETLKS